MYVHIFLPGHSSDGMEEDDFPGDPSDRNSQVNDPRLDNQTHTKERTVPKEVDTEKVRKYCIEHLWAL